jgi:hypothetical protein
MIWVVIVSAAKTLAAWMSTVRKVRLRQLAEQEAVEANEAAVCIDLEGAFGGPDACRGGRFHGDAAGRPRRQAAQTVAD